MFTELAVRYHTINKLLARGCTLNHQAVDVACAVDSLGGMRYESMTAFVVVCHRAV